MAGKALTASQILHGIRLGVVLVLGGLFLLLCLAVGFVLGAVVWFFNAPMRILGGRRG